MRQPSLDQRYRDGDSPIARRHGGTLIRTLRQTHGLNFAPGCDANAKLAACLHKLDDHSLSKLVHDAHGVEYGGT